VSVPEHTLRCGPETCVTSPLRCWQFQLGAAFANCFEISIPSPRRWECGNPKGISKECGKGGKPASWLSMLSTLCHFHGLLFARQMQDKPMCADQCSVRHSPRAVHRYSSLLDECIGDLSSAEKNQPTSIAQNKSSTESLADSPRAAKSLRAILGYVGPNPRKVQYLCRTFASADLHSTASLPSLS
jgi:hypothetical protein